MEYKKICPTHHLRYTGNRCPYCEKERIDRMVRKYGPKKDEEQIEEEPDFSILAEKFRIGKLNKEE